MTKKQVGLAGLIGFGLLVLFGLDLQAEEAESKEERALVRFLQLLWAVAIIGTVIEQAGSNNSVVEF